MLLDYRMAQFSLVLDLSINPSQVSRQQFTSTRLEKREDSHTDYADGMQMEMVAWYILELCLQEYNMLKFSPSLLAAAAIYSSNLILRISPWWSASLHYHTRYCESQLR